MNFDQKSKQEMDVVLSYSRDLPCCGPKCYQKFRESKPDNVPGSYGTRSAPVGGRFRVAKGTKGPEPTTRKLDE